jgi:hypothetical protein
MKFCSVSVESVLIEFAYRRNNHKSYLGIKSIIRLGKEREDHANCN